MLLYIADNINCLSIQLNTTNNFYILLKYYKRLNILTCTIKLFQKLH